MAFGLAAAVVITPVSAHAGQVAKALIVGGLGVEGDGFYSELVAVTTFAIRLPVPQPTEVDVTVFDVDGTVLGGTSTQDAPQFGYDICLTHALHRGGVPVGVVGISGDGIDQDDMIAAAGRTGFAITD
ncbi:hypothetical protein HDA40_005843 [Hamadaea flava]|uniref:Uncharacterized protein n=1 Tax=Hamadaea flava TaxID=1742688 RepID=A0ABV8LS46_9ACTN|nr:hypothetical protein [Hamadaea flava]MCP2327336.1 hypothetical protein [Hamadaea flava]